MACMSRSISSSSIDNNKVAGSRRSKNENRRERLAQKLDACAAMVRRAERGPLLEATIQDLLEYCHEPAPEPVPEPEKKTTQPPKASDNNKKKWCQEHFCMGCACEKQQNSSSFSLAKPAFQQPHNYSSGVLAAGWIQQQHRVQGNLVWRRVLATIVEGQSHGEETTLFIYQEQPSSRECRATHHIPVRFFQNVAMLDVLEHKFALHISHLEEVLVFCCPEDGEAAQNWVATLVSVMEIAQEDSSSLPLDSDPPNDAFRDEQKVEHPPPTTQRSTITTALPKDGKRIPISELRAVAHGAGIQTAGMERQDLEQVVADLYATRQQPNAPRAGTNATIHPPENDNSSTPLVDFSDTTATVAETSFAPSPSAAAAAAAAPPPDHPSFGHAPTTAAAAQTIPFSHMKIKDLRAIAHGVGISTIGMERQELEKAVAEAYGIPSHTYSTAGANGQAPPHNSAEHEPTTTRQPPAAPATTPAGSGVPFVSPTNASPAPPRPNVPNSRRNEHQTTATQQPAGTTTESSATNAAPPPTNPQQPHQAASNWSKPRISIKELRAVAHGVGISTIGMERQELEAAVAKAYCQLQEDARGKKTRHTPQTHGNVLFDTKQHNAHPEPVKTATEEERKRHQKEKAETAFKDFAAELGKEREEEERHKAAAEEMERKRKEEVMQSHIGEHEERKQDEERLQNEQDAQKRAQAAERIHKEDEKKKAAEQAAGNQKIPHHKQYSQQQYPQQQWGQPQSAGHSQPPNFAQSNNQWYQQQYNPWQSQPTQFPPNFSGHSQAQVPPQPFSAQQPSHPPAANQTEDAIQSREKLIKQGVLVQWALQPPMFRSLRPVAVLLSTIHLVFPPKFGITEHTHFRKWKVLQMSDLCDTNGQPVDAKLEKARRRLSLVLHEDKYPADFSNEHQVLCKLLWAVINDAFDVATN
uniref:PH domain-containing protein n=1 Tax=Amphora coffeiformis TaxID=265554 RepID=A0A7S3LGM9_9STRA